MRLAVITTARIAGLCSGFSWVVETPDTEGETGYYT